MAMLLHMESKFTLLSILYVHVDGGLITEVGQFTINIKRLMVVNETILMGGR